MAFILNIDTSTERASIALAQDGKTISLVENNEQKDHAAWIQQAVSDALKGAGKKTGDLQAIGLSAGPGSYTGLRVGMATAKGLCYALSIPLIAVNTLEAMAEAAAIKQDAALYCPMIDARRMEVFTALYDKKGEAVLLPGALILTAEAFSEALNMGTILFFGNGGSKFRKILSHPNARYSDLAFNAADMSLGINKKYNLSEFSDLAYTEPIYIKEFYTNTFRKSL